MKINKFLFYKNMNYFIELQSKIILFIKRVYEISKKQIIIVKDYIEKMLKKSYIRANISLYITFVLIVKKFDDDLRICVNYRALNALIIRNRNAFSLIKDILIKLYIIIEN